MIVLRHVGTYYDTKRSTYKAPAPGLEHLVLEHGEWIKPGSFKTMMDSMVKHMTEVFKKGGPKAAKAIKTRETKVQWTYRKNGSKKEELKYAFECKLYLHKDEVWKKTLGCIFRSCLWIAVQTWRPSFMVYMDGRTLRRISMGFQWLKYYIVLTLTKITKNNQCGR